MLKRPDLPRRRRCEADICRVEQCHAIVGIDLSVVATAGVWSQRQSRTTISGLTTTHHMWLKPVADGILKIETDDPAYRGADITMQEIGTNLLILTATSKRSGT